MQVRQFCAFCLRKFSTGRGEICFGFALNTLEETQSIRPIEYVLIMKSALSITVFAAVPPKEKNYVTPKIMIMQCTICISNFFQYFEVLSIFQL